MPVATGDVLSAVRDTAGGETSTSPTGTTHGELFFPENDPQLRESFVGSLQRQKPHGTGVLRWRRGNYVRFHGADRGRVCRAVTTPTACARHLDCP